MLYELFDRLNANNVKYVHFKSNEHLEESFCGDTDFDILVDQTDFARYVAVIESFGFRLFRSVANQSYNGVFDYLLLDAESKKTLHLHSHTVFITGKKFLKEYHLPIERYLLDNRVLDEKYGIYVLRPEIELVLLWIRYFSKTTPSEYILKKGKVGNGYVVESEWLKGRIDSTILRKVSFYLLGNDKDLVKRFYYFMMIDNGYRVTYDVLVRTRKYLELFKTEKIVELKYLQRKSDMAIRYFQQKYMHLPVPYRRVRLSGGKIVAVIGCDGAGKSTINSFILDSLRNKTDVFFEYMGSGDGHCYWYRVPFNLVKNIVLSERDKPESVKNESDTGKKLSIPKIVWGVLLAFEKKSKLHRVLIARKKGRIVLCDRYPQTQFMVINDGPLLYDWIHSDNHIKRFIATWENSVYKNADRIKPDLLIKLMISEETSRERKPNENPVVIKNKIELMETLKIPAEKEVVVDANLNLDEVMGIVYENISECIEG